MLVFVDESGDQGFGPKSSPFLVFAMVIFKNGKDAKAVDAAIAALKNNGIRRQEFKFRGSTKNIKDSFFRAISNRNFDVRAVVIEKQKFLQLMQNAPASFSKSQLIYYVGLHELISSYPFNKAKIMVDKKADRKLLMFMKAHMDLLNQSRPNMIVEYSMKDSATDNLIQLADMVVGAIARSYYPSKPNRNRWRRKLKLKRSEIIEIK